MIQLTQLRIDFVVFGAGLLYFMRVVKLLVVMALPQLVNHFIYKVGRNTDIANRCYDIINDERLGGIKIATLLAATSTAQINSVTTLKRRDNAPALAAGNNLFKRIVLAIIFCLCVFEASAYFLALVVQRSTNKRLIFVRVFNTIDNHHAIVKLIVDNTLDKRFVDWLTARLYAGETIIDKSFGYNGIRDTFCSHFKGFHNVGRSSFVYDNSLLFGCRIFVIQISDRRAVKPYFIFAHLLKTSFHVVANTVRVVLGKQHTNTETEQVGGWRVFGNIQIIGREVYLNSALIHKATKPLHFCLRNIAGIAVNLVKDNDTRLAFARLFNFCN